MASADFTTPLNVAKEVAAMERMTSGELVEKYAEVFGDHLSSHGHSDVRRGGSMSGPVLKAKLHFGRREKGRKRVKDGERPVTPARGVPRVAKLMALAIRFEGLIQDGVVKDQAELARLGHVSRARLTQIMNLLCLAPDIQEALLFLSATERGREAVTERDVREIAREADWRRQRGRWEVLAGTVTAADVR